MLCQEDPNQLPMPTICSNSNQSRSVRRGRHTLEGVTGEVKGVRGLSAATAAGGAVVDEVAAANTAEGVARGLASGFFGGSLYTKLISSQSKSIAARSSGRTVPFWSTDTSHRSILCKCE